MMSAGIFALGAQIVMRMERRTMWIIVRGSIIHPRKMAMAMGLEMRVMTAIIYPAM
jgi:hypothetical protein